MRSRKISSITGLPHVSGQKVAPLYMAVFDSLLTSVATSTANHAPVNLDRSPNHVLLAELPDHAFAAGLPHALSQLRRVKQRPQRLGQSGGVAGRNHGAGF